MLRNSVRLFTAGSIEVGVHYSWLAVFGLVTWSLATGSFPTAYAEVTGGAHLSTAAAWTLGAVASLLLFASVLVHELAHSFVAQARGLEARSITLFLFGGVSNLGSDSESPGTEFLVAIVGPLTSLVLAGVAFGGAIIVANPYSRLVFGYLAVVNALVAAFNIIPGFPLDGGRVLRSVVWRVTNSLRRGTEIAAGVGQVIGFGLIAWGLVTLFFSPADLFSALWIAAIGWFLQNAARAGRDQTVMSARLQEMRVRDLVRRDPVAVDPDATAAEVIEGYLPGRNRRAVAVCADGHPVGIVTVGDVRTVPMRDRATTRVTDVMGGRQQLVTLRLDDTLSHALELFSAGDHQQLPVVQDGALVGTLVRADVIRQLQLRGTPGTDR